MTDLWPWAALALLGAYHGINPGMGWLFAVSLGLQERSRAAVIRAFAPIAAGHFVSIAAVVALVAALRFSVAPETLRYSGAGVLILFGIYKLVVPMSHPRWVGMRVGPRQLALWSFLMATAHGAGLMVAPIVLKMGPGPTASPVVGAPPAVKLQTVSLVETRTPACHACPAPTAAGETPAMRTAATTPAPAVGAQPAEPSCHAQICRMAGSGGTSVLAAVGGAGLHTLAMFLAMAGIAVLVYDRIGLRILRTAWVNLDLVWALALIGAGVVTLVV